MSRCSGRDPETGSRCALEAAPGSAYCPLCGRQASMKRLSFARWMQQVGVAIEARSGLHPEDLPDCPYADWHGEGWEPGEAATEALERAL